MFQKTKRQMKRMFSAKKVQMLTLMLLCGTTAVMAQNSAGGLLRRYDRTGDRDRGNRQVRPHHGQTVLRHCRCSGYRRRYLGVHRHESTRNRREMKKIMMVVGACIFLIAAAQALPMFFGIGA